MHIIVRWFRAVLHKNIGVVVGQSFARFIAFCYNVAVRFATILREYYKLFRKEARRAVHDYDGSAGCPTSRRYWHFSIRFRHRLYYIVYVIFFPPYVFVTIIYYNNIMPSDIDSVNPCKFRIALNKNKLIKI